MMDNLNVMDNTNCDDLNDIIHTSGIVFPNEQIVDIEDNKIDGDNTKSDVDEMNAYFELRQRIYEEVLSPQLEKNEELKRIHKNVLMTNIFKILKWQFIFTYLFVSALLIAVVLSNIIFNLNTEVIKIIVKFIEFYITSIVVELISILFFIVRNVFDKSIVDLFRNFDNTKKKKRKKKKQDK